MVAGGRRLRHADVVGHAIGTGSRAVRDGLRRIRQHRRGGGDLQVARVDAVAGRIAHGHQQHARSSSLRAMP